MRLIDANALREHMYHEAFETDSGLQKWDCGLWIRYKMFEDIIDTETTIDTEPVKHGHWIDKKGDPFYNQCSECGAYVSAYLLDIFLDADKRGLHYCPNCGAKMDR